MGTGHPFGQITILGNHGRAQMAQQQAYQQAANMFAQSQMGLSQVDQLQNIAAHQQLANLGNALATRQPEPAHLRTPEEITAQLKARLADMEAEAKKKAELDALPKCKTCRWRKPNGILFGVGMCHQPLVMGFSGPTYLGSMRSELCGPEKALWEERIPLFRRFIDWFFAPWREDQSVPD